MSEVSTVPENVHFQIKLPFAALPIIVARSPGHFAFVPPVKLVFVVLLQHQTLTFLNELSAGASKNTAISPLENCGVYSGMSSPGLLPPPGLPPPGLSVNSS